MVPWRDRVVTLASLDTGAALLLVLAMASGIFLGAELARRILVPVLVLLLDRISSSKTVGKGNGGA